MTAKRIMIRDMLTDGKTYQQISKIMCMSMENLYATVYQMRLAGVVVPPQKKARKLNLSPAQRLVLCAYSQERSIDDIAKQLCVNRQTVMNIASTGMRRIGLRFCTGEARIRALQSLFPTMEDPAFSWGPKPGEN